MKKLYPFLLALLSGLLLSLAWQNYFTPFIFVAFVPLLFIADEFLFFLPKKFAGLKKFWIFYFIFLVWNFITTWWVYNASETAFLAWTLNALFMTLTLRIAWWTKKQFTGNWSYFILIPFWLAFECLHQNWDLSWPWLTLGNVFAFRSELVQWYEITGTSGGSVWVLAINIWIYLLIKERIQMGNWSKKIITRLLFVALVPCFISLFLYLSVDYRLKDSQLPPIHVIVVQPNIDPYGEKFIREPQLQLDKVVALVKEKVSLEQLKNADYLVLPETFLTANIWEDELDDYPDVNFLRESFISKNPKLKIITGANIFHLFEEGQPVTSTAHKFTDADAYYDMYNSAIQIDARHKVQIYRKSKLVPGAEIMPFLWLVKPIEKFALNLGGIVGSLGKQNERSVFNDSLSPVKIAPIICYESVYAEYISEYAKNGATMLAIITNDGWWGDTPGKRQHLVYGALRAIETRKPIARSANTGISCFVNEKGQIYDQTQWWVPEIIQAEIKPNTYRTLFVIMGDILAKTSLITSVIFFVLAVYRRFFANKRLSEKSEK